LVAIAAHDPGEATALADRLARFVASEVTWGGVRLCDVRLDQVRARILVADHDSYLFAGPLRDILGTRDGPDDDRVRAALHTASADDIVDALPAGLATEDGAHGWSLSGGERQRVRLARAQLAQPDVLVLVDPTSAVDAHTEARIAARLREARAGRTTVVFATSPLLLGQADLVAHLRDGRVVATGTHAELLAGDPGYRGLVSRDSDTEAGADTEAAAR
jgi:ABC-type multidrug transport system fused ATPase/permease subunit